MKKAADGLFLFVTANEHERHAFEEKFVRYDEQYILAKTYYTGMFGCYPAAYIHMESQGVTDPSATPLVSRLVEKLHPVAVVMVGIAFGADLEKQKIGDVLVSDKILPYDSQKLVEKETEYKESSKEVGFQLLNAFREYRDWTFSLKDSKQSNVHIGAILTGSRLINDYSYRTKLLNDFAFSKPIGGEMEAQGIYSMCRICGITEWIIVKGICDWGYNKNSLHKEDNQIIAAQAAVSYCHHVFMRQGIFNDLIHLNSILETKNNFKTNTKFDKAVNHFNKDECCQSLKILKEIESEYLKYTLSQKSFFWMIGYCYLDTFDKQKTDDQAVFYLTNAICYLTKAINLVADIDSIEDIKIYKCLIKAHLEIAHYKNANENYETVRDLCSCVIKQLSKNNSFASEYVCFKLDLAVAYENLFDTSPFEQAGAYLYKAQSILNDIYNNNNSLEEDLAFRLLHNLGRVCTKFSEHVNDMSFLDEALWYYQKAITVPIAHIEKNPIFFAQTYVNIGNVYLKKASYIQDNDSGLISCCNLAIKNYSTALDVYLHTPSTKELAMTYSNIATTTLKLYKATGDNSHFLTSEKNYLAALNYRNMLSDPIGYAKTQKGLGELYLNKGTQDNDTAYLDKATSNFDKALAIWTKEKYIKNYCLMRYYQAIVVKCRAIHDNSLDGITGAMEILKGVYNLCKEDSNSELYDAVINQMNELNAYL